MSCSSVTFSVTSEGQQRDPGDIREYQANNDTSAYLTAPRLVSPRLAHRSGDIEAVKKRAVAYRCGVDVEMVEVCGELNSPWRDASVRCLEM
ncbi:hypothetical protein E2C01_014048 [Portunus trituberculatus]|uniref:Uncharacterized protein n=1 Tax=Portunus trituberculatus TaxID=210409 RepID=A0A5B7DIW8_PORTR|nr:hypothetical protein [Portunus trituberculatus]